MKMNFKDMDDFLSTLNKAIIDNLEDDYHSLVVVGSYDFITDLLNKYLTYYNEGEYKLIHCELESPEMNGYDEAYAIEFCSDGEIWVTKTYNDLHNRYNQYCASSAYVQEEFADKWHESNSPAIVISFSNGIKVMEDKWEDLKVNDNGKGFTYSGSNGNSNFFFEYSSSEKLPKEFIDVVKKLFS